MYEVDSRPTAYLPCLTYLASAAVGQAVSRLGLPLQLPGPCACRRGGVQEWEVQQLRTEQCLTFALCGSTGGLT